MASPLKNLLAQQASQLDVIGQKAVPAREFLTHVSPLLSEGSPARNRCTSAGSPYRTASTSPSRTTTSSAAVAVAAEPAVANATIPSTAVAVASAPVAPDAYMSELPLPPYGSTAHLSLHVTETLELVVRVLRKNAQVGRQLTDRDVKLLDEIFAFKPSATHSASTEAAEATAPHSDNLQDLVVNPL